ncbi:MULTISPECIES: DUF1697 domain-containing protein [Neobacillus]|uniref:DUF1697 domain-containing protein n=1 Tax=Neobacillus rhizophilus TaxID=2833579 RepID=A0A942UBQ4_9BACI|nr:MULTISPECIES: DUF1697 domain-containing protein [Neobacillus]MBS4216347.1 DUF1697 domain-containing protein [Neobacillus rhizophilus]MBU8917095.1 DUF1697 domain-containing protein [Bacillus sp. FJAT-29953]
MTIYIALLRGINVGGHNIIKMADLKSLLEELGLKKVKTYIQSGNVLFESNEKPEKLTQLLEDEIAKKFGFPVPVVLRTAEGFERIIRTCPFPTESLKEEESIQVAFLAGQPSQEGVQQLGSIQSNQDEFKIEGKDVYLYLRQSIRTSKLAQQLPKLGVPATVRNWKTVVKLDSLAKAFKE